MITLIFVLVVLMKISVGFFCAQYLTSDNPLWVRLVVLAPCLAGFYVLIALVQGEYTAYWGDILRTVAVIPLYMLVASRFTDNPWLDIRVKDKE